MSTAYFDNIHNDTMRLRLLLTNRCQQDCPHCLNEYMCKPGKGQSVESINIDVLKQTVSIYTDMMKAESLAPKVYLSGGEPTLHSDFREIVSFIKGIEGTELTLCTNGNRWATLLQDGTYDKIDHLHFSFGFLQSTLILDSFITLWESLRKWVSTHDKKNIVFAMVTTAHPDFERVVQAMLQYQQDTDYGFTLKLWGDLRFSQDHPINQKYRFLMKTYPDLIHRGPIQHPVNRGIGCDGCTKTCPTLKALWVRPDNTYNPCPQSNKWFSLQCSNGDPISPDMMAYHIRLAHTFHFMHTEASNTSTF